MWIAVMNHACISRTEVVVDFEIVADGVASCFPSENLDARLNADFLSTASKHFPCYLFEFNHNPRIGFVELVERLVGWHLGKTLNLCDFVAVE
jgi:hypothetical protein